MKILDKIKVIAIFLVCFSSVLQSYAQCGSFNVIVVQNDLCNSNGIVDVVYSHPYSIEVQFPNFTTATYNSTQDTITLTGLFGGNYTITTQDVNSCSESISLTSNSIATTVFSPTFFTNGYNVNCYGDCNGQIFVNLTNPSELYTIDWYMDSVFGAPFYSSTTATSNSSSQNNLCAGQYVFLFTSESGCQSTRNYTLREPDSLDIQGIASEVVCSSGSSGSVEIDVTGGVGESINNANGNVVDTLDYTFSWTSTNAFTSTDEDIFGLTSGDYTVSVTDANGCTAQKLFSVVDTVAPVTLSLISQDSVKCFGLNDGALEVSASGGRGTLEFSIDNVIWQSSGLFEDLTAGSHDIYARDTNGCIGVGTFVVLTYPEIFFDVLTHDTIFCQDSLANLHVQAYGGNAPYQYVINIPQLTGLFEDLPAADYTIFAEDAFGCLKDTTLSVIEVPFLSVDVESTDLSCFNSADGSIVVTPSSGTTPYDITIGTLDTLTNTSFQVSDFVTGDYNVSVVDAKGCPFDTLIQIAEPDEIVLSFDNVVNSTCFGADNGSIDITHTGGVGELTFSWSKDGLPLAINAVSAVALSPGSYSVFATDETLCVSQTIDTVITEPSLLELSIDSISNPLCFGGSDGYISVSSVGGTLPYSYNWYGDTAVISSDFLSNVSDGVYNVIVTDNNNCSDTILNIALNQPNQMLLVNPIPNVDVACFGASTGQINVEVIGGTGPYNFSSLPNIGNTSTPAPSFFTISDIPSGQYQITVIDSNGCEFGETFEIQQNTEIQAQFSGITPETCNADNGQVTVTASGGVPNYTYDWVQSGQSSSTAILLSGGENKFVKITDSKSCEKDFMVFVPKIAPVEITSINTTDNLCSGDTLGELKVTAFGSAYPFTYTLSGVGNVTSSDTTATFTNLLSNSYTLSVADSNGCTDTQSSVLIEENFVITVEIDPSSTTMLACNGDDNGKIFLNIQGGNPFPGNYYWLFVNDPNFSQQITSDSITGLSAGTYNLSIQDANGCVQSISYEISEPEPISVVQVLSPTSCNDGDDGEALIIISGGTTNYTLSSNTSSLSFTQLSADTFMVSGLSEGLYFYDIIDANGCDKLNNSFYISHPSAIEVVNISSTLESCLGWDATASVSVTGGTTPYTYLWSYDIDYQQPVQLENNTLNPSVNSPNVEFLTEGFYYVHIWDFNSCYTVDSIYISKTNTPTLSLLGTVDNLCYGNENGQISLTASGGTPFYEYSLNGGVTWQYLSTFSGLEEGFYNATVRDSLGCSDELEDIEILAPSPISVSVAVEDVSCVGSSDGSASVVLVSGGTPSSNGYSYSWQNENGVNLWPGNLSAINPTVNNLLPGSYQLEVEDNNGCIITYSPVIVDEPLDVTVDLSVLSSYNGKDISCFGFSDGIILANAGGGAGSFTFKWYVSTQSDDIRTNISAGFDTLSLVPQGDYTVVVTDSRGCTNQAEISLTHPDAIDVDFEDVINIRCEGNNDGEATATFSGGLGFGNYSVVWTNSQNNNISLIPKASNLSAGTYFATYTDNNGCVGSDSITIDYSELFSLTNTNDTTSVSCLGAIDGSFNFNVVGGWLPYTYDWNDPLNQHSATAVGLAPGMWYTNIITDGEGCILIDSVYVTSPDDIVEITTYSIVDNDCYGETNGAIDLVVSGGTPNYDFQWSGPSTNSTNEDVSNLAKGVYNVVITDAFGCEITATYEIDGPDNPLLINSVNTTNVSCNGLSDGTASLNNQITGGTSPYVNIDWDGENPSILSAGNYTVEVTDNNGCKSSSSYTIFEPDAYSVSLDVVNEYCEGQNGSIVVHASGATPFNDGYYNYEIEPISGISPSLNYQSSAINNANIVVDFPADNDVSDTLFLLSITDDNGCIYTEEVEIHPARAFNYNATMSICYGDSIVIDANGFNDYSTYSWSINPFQEINSDESKLGLVVTNSSTIFVTVSDYASACSFTDELDIVVLNPVIASNEDFGIIRGESATLTIIDGEPPYLWSTTETTSDIVVSPLITTNYIAYALDTVTGCIGNDTVRVFVGMNEGFSPNGDGYNDTWEISYLNQYESSKIEIFNRWGASLWSSSYPSIENWDGKFNGSDLPVGTYYYIITFDSSLNKEPLTGPVTIVR
ncbi:MAG: gliding motility-associated C-terminal domain-containing protein [Flavobacteriales bacterium]|nr:gliding motility-associated C-terminal domain-containing protein [Flavobacteriales bacterium]